MSRTVSIPIRLHWISLVALWFATLGGTVRAQEKTESVEPPLAASADDDPRPVKSPKPLPAAPTARAKPARIEEIGPIAAFVADGAGNFLNMSRHLRSAAQQEGVALQVVTYPWSHGTARFLADHFSYERARREGAGMAARIEGYRKENPRAQIHVVGHSAGVAVALAALESLPPEAADGAFIVSPSVSADYDLRPALKAVKKNMYVHYSTRDWFWMGVATRIAGSTDRRRGPTSGRVGFRACLDDPECKAKLVQRAWEPSDRDLGNTGGHFGGYEDSYLRQHVLPMMMPARNSRTTAED